MDSENESGGRAAGNTGGPKGGRKQRRQGAKDRATRRLRWQQAGMVALAALILFGFYLVIDAPGVSGGRGGLGGILKPGLGGGAVKEDPSTSSIRSPRATKLDDELAKLFTAAPGFKLSGPVIGVPTEGFAPICGKVGASDALLGSAAGISHVGSVDGHSVGIVEWRGVYYPGGVAALLKETAAQTCMDRQLDLPGAPENSVLLRDLRLIGTVYYVAQTSANTAVYVKVSATSEDSAVQALYDAVPAIQADAAADSGKIVLPPKPAPTS